MHLRGGNSERCVLASETALCLMSIRNTFCFVHLPSYRIDSGEGGCEKPRFVCVSVSVRVCLRI